MADSAKSIKRVLITGGSGFIGTNLVDYFFEAGAQVLSIDHSPPRKPQHARVWSRVDLLNLDSLCEVVRLFEPTHVLHMGARTDLIGQRVEDYAANTIGVGNLITAVSDLACVERVIFASSRMVCKIGYQPRDETDYCPTTPYGASKAEMERIVRSAAVDVRWTIVRPSSIWGPWFDVPYRDFFLSVARGRYFHIGRHRIRKSFGFVGNTVYQLHKLLLAPADTVSGRTIYLADYPPLEVRAWAEHIRRVAGAPAIRTAPYSVLRLAAWSGDVLDRLGWNRVPLTTFRLENLLTEMVYDLTELEQIAGPLPYSLEESTALTVAWLRERGDIPDGVSP